jgi:sugar lactone lactonase YvrE
MQGDPFTKDKNGFISKVDVDGKIIKLKWIEGLNAPKGLTISKGKLYAADVNELVEIDIKKSKITKKLEAAGATFLNDVTVDTNGNIYVSDMFNDSIYKLDSFGQLTKWLYSPKLEAPNGLHYEKGQLIVASWGHPTNGFAPSVVGHLKSISLKNKEIKSLGNGQPVGTLDGIESDKNGNYFVSDWVGGNLLYIQPDGNFKSLVTLTQGAADHEVIHDKNLLILPMMNIDDGSGKLIAFEIK